MNSITFFEKFRIWGFRLFPAKWSFFFPSDPRSAHNYCPKLIPKNSKGKLESFKQIKVV